MFNVNFRREPAVLAFAALALATSTPVAAQIEEVLVSARKLEERAQDIPISVSAYSGDELHERDAQDLFDISTFTPGFSFERLNRYGVQGGVSRPVIRGMSNILGEGNASVFVDGILYSDSVLAFPMEIVDRVEVIRGPQAALFGRSTFSGAINYVTKKGSNDSENRVSLRAAEYGDYEANFLSRGAVVADKLFYMAHARYYTFDGMYRNTLDGQRIGDEESTNVNASIEYRPTEAFSILLSAGYSKDRDGLAAITLQDRFANNCYLNTPTQYYCGPVKEQDGATLDRAGLFGTEGVHRDSTRVSLQLSWDLSSDLTLVSNTGAFFTEQDYGYDSTYQAATALGPTTVPGAPGFVRPTSDPVRNGGVMRNEVTDRDEWSTELRLQSSPDKRFRYLVGAYYYTSDRTLKEAHFLATAPTIDSGETSVENQAVFASVGFDITDRWDVTAELRYSEDDISNTKTTGTIGNTFDSTSPRVTTTYKLTPNNMVYANVAKGNKPGVINADPRFPPEITFANEEESWNYEVGTKNTFFDGVLLTNLAVYYIDWTDQQITSIFTFPPPTGGTQSYIRNAGKSEIKGVELQVDAALMDNLTVGATYSYTDAKFKELQDAGALGLFGNASLAGKKLPGVPEQQASLYGKFTFPLGEVNQGFVRADTSFTDLKYDQIYNLASTGEAIVANLSVGMENDNWSVSLFVNNLTDDDTPSSVTRYVDQLNLNVPQYPNSNPAQANVPGSTTTERAFFFPLAPKRVVGLRATYQF